MIHRRAYRETSMLVDFFCKEQGKVSAVAKGVRNAKSDKRSLLQPLQFLSFEVSGRSSLKTLGSIEANEKSIALSGNMLYCAFYINELLSRTLPEAEPFAALFESYQINLAKLFAIQNAGLEDAEALLKVQPMLRQFEFSLLEMLGYLPDLSLDVSSDKPLLDEHHYQFDSAQGLLASKIVGQGMRGLHIKQMLAQEWNEHSLQVAKRIVRLALSPLLGDKPLKSRELFSYNSTKKG